MSTDPPPPEELELIPTRDSLLSRLKDWRDDESWRDFFNTYWKLVYGVALKSGLSAQEAHEVVQETVITVARRISEFKYDPAVCSFKTWLLNLTRWRIIDQVRRRPPHGPMPGLPPDPARTSTIDRVADPAAGALDQVWNQEWEHHLLNAAIQRVKRKVNPEHYQIFHLCTFKEWPIKKVAAELGISAGRIYLVKHRIGSLLKREVKTLERKMNKPGAAPGGFLCEMRNAKCEMRNEDCGLRLRLRLRK